jgi:hypothetical protein
MYNTIDKDNRYWKIHKEIYNKLFGDIDSDIADKIYKNPNCAEGRLLDKRVGAEIKERLEQEPVAQNI